MQVTKRARWERKQDELRGVFGECVDGRCYYCSDPATRVAELKPDGRGSQQVNVCNDCAPRKPRKGVDSYGLLHFVGRDVPATPGSERRFNGGGLFGRGDW